MDVNDLRIGITVIGLLLFLLLVLHTWSRRRRGEYAVAEQLPFSGDALDATAGRQADRGDRP